MTPERLREIIERCVVRRREENNRVVHQRDLARFLGVEPITLRRWLRGHRPIPRQTEIIMEIYDAYPEHAAGMTAAANGGARKAT
jgi:transcriptional regulator with XRE-family HTH domain